MEPPVIPLIARLVLVWGMRLLVGLVLGMWWGGSGSGWGVGRRLVRWSFGGVGWGGWGGVGWWGFGGWGGWFGCSVGGGSVGGVVGGLGVGVGAVFGGGGFCGGGAGGGVAGGCVGCGGAVGECG